MSAVPTIDLARVDDAALAAIDAACRDHGFFLLVNHGMEGLFQGVRDVALRFFHGPRRHKEAVLRRSDNPMGYYDRELTKRRRDQKEVFDYHVPPSGPSRTPWPEAPANFEAVLSRHFRTSSELSREVLRLLCAALGIEPTTLDDRFERESSAARLNFYPSTDPVPETERGDLAELGGMALQHHTDQGAITLLMQDEVGGLQAHSTEDGWIDVPPHADSLVVNVGDIVQVWSNGAYKAALHRVAPMPPGRERFSVPFFFQPSLDTQVAPLPGLGAPTYRAFPWLEYITGRVNDNFADVGEDDIQVERYRIAG